MPSLSDAMKMDMTGYAPVEATPSSPTITSPPASDLQPTYPNMMRCPLPPIFRAEPDSLRQFYLGSAVPQFRLLSAAPRNSSSGASGGTTIVNTTTSGGGSSKVVIAQQAIVTTTVLAPGAKFVGTLSNISRSFQLLSVASSVQARVTLYGTAGSQTNDLYRGVDIPPPAGSTQGIITDVIMDTAPYQWGFQNRMGANGDVPQNQEAYITITNLSAAATAVTVTIQYVPLEG